MSQEHDFEETPDNTNPALVALLDEFETILEGFNIPFARDYSCCRTCARYELKLAYDEDDDLFEYGKPDVLKYVYYHGQEAQSIREGATECWMGWELPEEDEKNLRERMKDVPWFHWELPSLCDDGQMLTKAMRISLPSSPST